MNKSNTAAKSIHQKKYIPKLNLGKMIDLEPSFLMKDKPSLSQSRINKDKIYSNTLRDSINNEDESLEIEKIKFRRLVKYIKSFLKTIQQISQSSTEEDSSKLIHIQLLLEDYKVKLHKLENQDVSFTCEDSKMKEELENCKKIALMYEQKVKIKNETIFSLRAKAKEHENLINFIKNQFKTVVETQGMALEKFMANANEKLLKNNKKFEGIQEMIKKRLTFGLDEIRKVVEMVNKNAFFDEQIEMYKKNLEENELNSKETYDKMKELEEENGKYRGRISELEKMISMLKTDAFNLKTMMNEIENLTEANEKLKKQLKIKEFELKQAEFEKKELDSDKNELLTKVEALEIEIIEVHEALNTLNIKYNQEIESFIYTNTVQKNEINELRKEKTEYKEKYDNAEEKLKDINQKYNDLLRDSHNLSSILEEKERKIKESYEKIESAELTARILAEDKNISSFTMS
ncbi:hypothetical protein SteCoe_22662 [Stentor coeruleus]|uniref:Uncharacterized protein n=1 Tax=Stentor coeruleus TaxID=5963 RepID=A0A1R2BLP7_9CILI|nr:hypothetical protein SteCoe_22662 [Stentor coeruleus]